MSKQLPEKINRYKIESELGRGGMATVFKAYDPRFQRHIALKILPREFLHEAEFRTRFTREAQVIAKLEHPAIVPVYDFGEDDGQPFLVMRYMPGGSLADRLADGPLPIDETSDILKRLGSALDHAHSQGIVHRDLKPGNVLFDQYGDAYLADFGIVRITTSSSALTASGSLVGTPTYMSPEQVYGDKEIDGRSDIYALGVILFQMLTGHTPFAADTPARLMMKHVMDPVPRITEDRPDLPPAAEEIIGKAMAKKRDERFPTARALSEALTTISTDTPEIPGFEEQLADLQSDLADGETAVPADPTPTAGAAPTAISSPTPAPAPAARKSQSRIPVWVWAIVGTLALLCVGGTIVASIFLSNRMQANEAATSAAIAAGQAELATKEAQSVAETATAVALITANETATVVAAATADARAEFATATAAAVMTATAAASPTPTATEEPPTGAGDDIAATRESIAATRAAGGNDDDAGTVDVAATRESIAATRAAGDVPPLTFAGDARFGPVSGELIHNEENELVESNYAEGDYRDFFTYVKVTTPFDAADANWDMGFFLRQAEANEELRLVVRADGTWLLGDRAAGEDIIIQDGDVSDILNTTAASTNELAVIAQGERGYFFLNRIFVATLDMSTRNTAGGLAFNTGFYRASELTGAATAYEGFAIWDLAPDFGPVSGSLEHIDDNLIKTFSSEGNWANFMVEATFTNPYALSVGEWDYGFSFRDVAVDEEYWLIVSSAEDWSLINRSNGEDDFVDDDFLDILNLGSDETNQLRLIALGADGYFFVNDQFVAQLDLSDRTRAGDIEVATAFFVGDEVPGNATLYTDFQVWPLP